MVVIEPHFMAAFMGCVTACEILDVLPQGDLTDELKNILDIQFDLFVHLMEGKHYGSNNLNDFMAYTDEIKSQIITLKQSR
jgi:hypothetical protein